MTDPMDDERLAEIEAWLAADLYDGGVIRSVRARDIRALVARVRAVETYNTKLYQDRYDALSVTSREGLLASEWIARTGKAERERDEARKRIAELEREHAEMRLALEAVEPEAVEPVLRASVEAHGCEDPSDEFEDVRAHRLTCRALGREDQKAANRWVRLRATSPSGKTLFACRCCGRKSPTPDKGCATFADPKETWGCSNWSPDDDEDEHLRRHKEFARNIRIRDEALKMMSQCPDGMILDDLVGGTP